MRLYPEAGHVKELVYSGKMPEAKQLLEQALKGQESAAVLNDLALVCAKFGQDQQMLNSIERAEKLANTDIRVKVNRYYLSELAKLNRDRGQNAQERVINLKCGDPGLKPRLSIVLPTFNRAELIKEAIVSVLAQQFQDWELVIVNDGGDPGLAQTLEGIWDPRFVYINAQHSGNAGSNNVGLRFARGGLIGFLDDDDVFYPDHFQKTVDYFDRHPGARIVYRDLKRVWLDTSGNTIKHRDDVRGFRKSLKPWDLFTGNLLAFNIRRECLEKVSGFLEGLQFAVSWDFPVALSEYFKFDYLPGFGGEFRFRRGLQRMSNCGQASRARWRNLILYHHGISPLYSFGTARGRTSRALLSGLSALVEEFGWTLDALELVRLHQEPEYSFFFSLAERLAEENEIQASRACLKYALRLAPHKARIWKRLARSYLK